jgi:hypothetical protein
LPIVIRSSKKKPISALKKELVKRRDGLYISTSRSWDIAAEDNFQQVQTMTESRLPTEELINVSNQRTFLLLWDL